MYPWLACGRLTAGAAVAAGKPVQMMQDWLAERNLDRKALDALTRNALQYQQYIDWQDSQGRAVGEPSLSL